LKTREREKKLKKPHSQRRRGTQLTSRRKLRLPRLREQCFTKLETLKRHLNFTEKQLNFVQMNLLTTQTKQQFISK